MIKIIYVADPEGGKLTMRAEGHAGYAPAGQDIVCAAVSCLMQTLAYSAAEDERTSSCIYQGKEGPVVSVEAGDSVLMRDKFELVADGLDLLAEQYPENVNFKKRCKCSPAVDLQLFAEGGDGAAAAGGDGAAPAAEEKAVSAPAQSKGREAAAAEVDEMLSPAEEPDAEQDAAEGEEQDGAADKSGTDPEAHRKAFGELMRGEYNREFGEMIVQATQKAYDSILNEQGPVEAAKMEAIQQEWDAAVERIRAEDPDFDIKTALADPDFAQMLKLGVKMEDAYKARYFDDIMARKTAETAKKTESGVVERIRQRGARPSENGTNPGGAAVLKTDVSKLTPAQCEELERRAMRGQIITF